MPLPTMTVSQVSSRKSRRASRATSTSIQSDRLRSSPTFMAHSPRNLSQGSNVREPGFVASVRPVALALDRCDAGRVGRLQIAPALEDLERVLLVGQPRSEEHTSELQSRGLISYAVFCLKK